MLIGQSVYVPASSDPGVIYYGPWLPRQGDSGTAVLEVIQQSSSGWEVVYKVYTKNAEDSDAAASNIGGMTATTVGTHLGDFSGCKELIRVLYWCKGEGTARWLHLRSNPIQWQPN